MKVRVGDITGFDDAEVIDVEETEETDLPVENTGSIHLACIEQYTLSLKTVSV